MSLKNSLIVFFLKMIRRLKATKLQDPQKPLQFLVVSTTALGDTLWATPALKTLKTAHPKAMVSVLTSPIGKEVLSQSPYVDEIFVLQKPHLLSLAKIYLKLRRRAIDTAFMFHTSQRAVLPFCHLLAPKKIIGSTGINKGLDTLLTDPIPQKYEHEIERRLRIVEKRAPAEKSVHLELFLQEEDRKNAEELLKNHNLLSSSALVGIHPGAKDKFKQWDPTCFVELGKRLQKSLNCSVLITGGPSEKELTKQIAKEIPGAVALTDPVPLKTLAALIERFNIFISNDTGPMHVAFAVKTPTVALFTATDSHLCGPHMAEKTAVLQKHLTCTPCLRKKCKLPFCMLQISPKEVEEKALSLMKGSPV